jgi:WD40 repeat protein
MKSMSIRWASSIALAAFAAMAPAADRLSPVALAMTPAGIVVLQGSGQVLRADLQAPVVFRPICQIYDVVYDMAAGVWNGQLSIFVVGLSSDRKVSRVTWYSADGRLMKQWPTLSGTLTGISFDASSGTIYLTGENSFIYSISVRGSAINHLTSIAGASRLGAITVDSTHSRLFVAATESGTVYAMDLTGRNQRQVARGLGSISAMAYDPDRGALYATDSDGHLWMLNPDTSVPPARIGVTTPLREPLGLALVPGGDLLVGDRGSRCVLRISPAGHVVAQFR